MIHLRPFVLVLGAVACARAPVGGSSPALDTGAPALTSDPNRFVVPAAQGKDFHPFRGAASFFNPSDADVAALEAKLPGYLATAAPKPPAGTNPLSVRAPSYKRQLVGHVDGSGARRIFANYFCRDPGGDPDRWKKSVVLVKDGGDCFFRVEYDVDKGSFSDLVINGDA